VNFSSLPLSTGSRALLSSGLVLEIVCGCAVHLSHTFKDKYAKEQKREGIQALKNTRVHVLMTGRNGMRKATKEST
jgi:hypothetical protein